VALVADAEAREAGQPGEAALRHPPVPAETGTALHTAPRDPGRDATSPALPAAASVIIPLVGVQLVRALAWPTAVPGPHARHCVQRGYQHHAVVPVGAAQRNAERRAAGIRDQVAFRARPAAIRRVRADLGTPFFADRLALSRAARLQSSCRASIQALQQRPMQSGPDPGRVPPGQPAPARLAAAAQLGRHLAPLDAGAQHEQDPGERRTVRRSRPPALRLRPLGRQQRLDHQPQVVRNKKHHATPTLQTRFCPLLQGGQPTKSGSFINESMRTDCRSYGKPGDFRCKTFFRTSFER